MTPEEIRRQLEYYRDLGIKDLYRREGKAAKLGENRPALELEFALAAGYFHEDIRSQNIGRIRSGVNWMRLNERSNTSPSVRT